MQNVVAQVDDPVVLRSIDRALASSSEFAMFAAHTESDVLECVDADSLLLTDLRSPNGLEFLRELRSQSAPKSRIPVVILTSSINEKVAVQALRDMATSYVPIRFIGSELLETIRNVFAVATAVQSRTRIMDCVTNWNNDFVLENDRTLIGPLVKYLQETTQYMGLLSHPGEETRLGIALEEALLNSLYHGNLEVASELREEKESKFYELVAQRSVEEPYCNRRIQVATRINRDRAVFIIHDEGPGFDVDRVPDPTDPKNVEKVCGRGMLLMRTFMDDVQYNEIGNQVTLVRRRQLE